MTRPALTAFQLSIRAAVAASAAVAVAQYLKSQLPICALISAVLVVDRSPGETRREALPRLLGTIVGAATGAALSQVLPSNPMTIGLGILVAMFLTHLMRLRGAARVAGFVSGIMVLGNSDTPWAYAYRRLIETSLGIGFAVLVSLVPRLIPTGTREPKSQAAQESGFPREP